MHCLCDSSKVVLQQLHVGQHIVQLVSTGVAQ